MATEILQLVIIMRYGQQAIPSFQQTPLSRSSEQADVEWNQMLRTHNAHT